MSSIARFLNCKKTQTRTNFVTRESRQIIDHSTFKRQTFILEQAVHLTRTVKVFFLATCNFLSISVGQIVFYASATEDSPAKALRFRVCCPAVVRPYTSISSFIGDI